jgi:predicted house-cleaning noncanonical NTP pyrophosphatase (MazG superfamily)
MTKVNNKLVRDKIPEVIAKSGKESRCRILEADEYRTELNKKLLEECSEWIESSEATEIADILEVLRAIADVKGFDWEKIEGLRVEKCKERGGFKEKIFLLDVTE